MTVSRNVQNMHVSVDSCSTGAPAEPALRRPGGRLSFGLHHAHTRVPEAPPVSGSFCRQAEEAGIGERARETITVGGSSPQAYVTDRPRRAPQPSRPIVLLGDVMLHPPILKFGGTSVADAAAWRRSRTGERHCGTRLRRTASACRRRSWRRH